MQPITLSAKTLVLVLALVAYSCSTHVADAPKTPQEARDVSDPLLDFTGIWVGTSTSSANDAKVKIAFDIKRESGGKFKGDYRCAPDNAICRTARGFVVSEEDTSWCLFFLRRFHPPTGEGEYTCYMDGGITDLGMFQLRRPLGE
jgi:hypothetical protein